MAKKSKKIKKLKHKLKANDVSLFPTPRAWGERQPLIMLDEASILASPATVEDLAYTPMQASHLSRLAPILNAKPSKRQWRRWAKANPRLIARITR